MARFEFNPSTRKFDMVKDSDRSYQRYHPYTPSPCLRQRPRKSILLSLR
jgi:hypothetical protein